MNYGSKDDDFQKTNLPSYKKSIVFTLLLIGLTTIIKNIYHYLEEFEHSGITQAFRDKWREWDHFIGEEVNIITEKQIITGLEQGIDEQGYLLLEVNNKEPWQRFNGGEVSLRKK